MEPNETNTEKRPLACEPSILSVAAGSAPSQPYDPLNSLEAEVNRFMATNTFSALEVTGFYVQARCVLNELRIARGLLADAKHFVEIYASNNPRWNNHYNGMQDPHGAHDLLKRITDALSLPNDRDVPDARHP